MDNQTFKYTVLLMEGLKIAPQYNHLAFIFLLIAYIFITVFNIGILVQILADKSLHEPMHILFCHLPINDVMGANILLPRLLKDILTDPSERHITYVECVSQAFFNQFFSTTSHTILMIMAFDRYVAICNPLRYSSIMSSKMMVKLSAGAWCVPLILVAILLSLSIRLSHCRFVVQNHYCDNASLFKLSCESVVINNVYGLTFTVVLLTSSMGSVFITYFRIAMICIKSKNKSTNIKAIKTCSTHLTVYLIMLISGLITIILHRFSEIPEGRKISAIIFFVLPSSLNPIIYGLQAKEIRQKVFKYFTKNNSMSPKECESRKWPHSRLPPFSSIASGCYGSLGTLFQSPDDLAIDQRTQVSVTPPMPMFVLLWHTHQRSPRLPHRSSLKGKIRAPLKQFQSLLEHMAAAAAVTQLGLLHLRQLQHWLHDRVSHNLDEPFRTDTVQSQGRQGEHYWLLIGPPGTGSLSSCSSRQPPPRRISLRKDLLSQGGGRPPRYLQHRLDGRLSPSTLNVDVAAISAHHAPINSRLVGQHNLVTRFLRGAQRLNPLRPSSIPTWGLSMVLKALQAAPFEHLQFVSLKFLTMKTLPLLRG
ncbi:olfactory receptor 13H1-like [Paramisgurnus dabryanus]|uniref:olfactory receptor 13H1-like n=1 Tax=Paramisgurnus dabryanus TaxID=90735 RepID=UPI003CCF5480